MAKSLFQKLNVLLKSSMHSVAESGAEAFSRQKPSHDLAQEIAELRQKHAKAVEEERRLAAQQVELQQEILRWDEQADVAVAAAHEIEARQAAEQVHKAKQQLKALNDNLDAHRNRTDDLMHEIDRLEARLDEGKASMGKEIEQNARSGSPKKVQMLADDSTQDESQSEEDDLAERRSRLAKPEQ